MSRRKLLYVLVALSFAIAAPAFAAKGGGGNSAKGGSTSGSTSTASSNTAPAPTGTIALDGAAYYNQTASFTATDPPSKYPIEASVACEQGGQAVYAEAQDMTGSSPYHPQFKLWSSTWQANGGGSAACTAKLYYLTWKGHLITGYVTMASQDFTANG